MDFPTQNGMIGALGGLVLGMIDYAVVSRFLGGRGERPGNSTLSAGNRERLMKATGTMSFLAMPVVGYFVGELVLG